MIRMLLVVYCMGIRSERRLCEEVHLNLAYRWFCGLGLDGKVPDHSTFSKNRRGRFRESNIAGILTVAVFAWKPVAKGFAEGGKAAVGGALLASMNTASEYGFGAVIATLPGFIVIRDALTAIPNPLVNEAVTVTALSGVTGSASGGMSIALAAMSNQFIAAANANGIPMQVLHRVASMASGGMDTLPHNGAVITLLAVCGLTHKQSYRDIFAVTCIKTTAAFVVIAVYYLTGLV